MLASRRRENPSRGRHRGRRQHRPSRVLRDRLGPGDPAARARHRLLGLVRGGTRCSAAATGAQLYDQQVEHARHLTLLPPGPVINLPFITPPTTALLALPFTALDPGTAFRVWSVIELLLLASGGLDGDPGRAVAVRVGRPARASPRCSWRWPAGGTYAFLLLGQIDGIAALGLAAAYAAWRRDRSGARRLLAGAGVRRDQAAPRDRARRLARSPGVTGARSPARPRAAPWSPPCRWPWSARPGSAASCRPWASPHGNTPGASTLGIPGLVASWLGSGDRRGGRRPRRIARSRWPGAACSERGRAATRATLEVSLAGAAALSLVASPHLLPHDLVILAPAFAWCVARAAAADAAPWPGMATIRVIGAWAVLGVLTPRRHRERSAGTARQARAAGAARHRRRRR